MSKRKEEDRPAGRPVERDYLTVLADSVPLDLWREICQSAAERAKAGDAKAREWLARYLMGENPLHLLSIAGDESVGYTTEAEIAATAKRRERSRRLSDLASY